jgi:hypothetical protein
MKNMMKHMDTKPWHRDIKPYKTNKLYGGSPKPTVILVVCFNGWLKLT